MGLKLGIVLSLAAILYGTALSPDILGFYHDDGVYAVTAKALAEGKGYRIISLPGSPVQMTYPIFYPAILSIVWRIFPHFPENIIALKIPSIIFSLLFLWVTYLYLVRRNYASPRMSLAIITMTAFNPWIVWTATMAMSEALYCLVSVLSLWMFELFISSTRGYKHLLYLTLSGLAIAISLMTRSIGISILGATFIYLFFHKGRDSADRNLCESTDNNQFAIQKLSNQKIKSSLLLKKRFMLAIPVVSVILLFLSPWIVWNILHYINRAHLETYPYRPVFYGSYSQFILWQWRDFGFVFFFKTFLFNMYRCFLGSIPNLILPGVDIGRVFPLNFIKDYILFGGLGILGSLLSLSVLISVIKDVIKIKLSLITLYIIFILIIVLLWPVEPDRFLLPVLPFILLLFLNGFSGIVGKTIKLNKVMLPKLVPQSSSSLILFFIIVNSGLTLAQDGRNIIASKKSNEWVEKEKIFHWIKENTKENDLFVSMISPAMYLYTGRKAVPPIVGIDLNNVSKPKLSNDIVIENFRNLLNYVNDKNLYLVKFAYSYPPIYEQIIDRMAIKYPGRISLIYESKSMKYAIYRME